MKQLIWKIILPLSIISVVIYTKWWYVLPVDAPKTLMSGFPFIWIGDGWHTSMSLQIFVMPLILNLAVFFVFWFVIVYSIHQYAIPKTFLKLSAIPLQLFAGVICVLAIYIGSMAEQRIKMNRDFDIKVLKTGYKFIWEHQDIAKLTNEINKKTGSLPNSGNE